MRFEWSYLESQLIDKDWDDYSLDDILHPDQARAGYLCLTGKEPTLYRPRVYHRARDKAREANRRYWVRQDCMRDSFKRLMNTLPNYRYPIAIASLLRGAGLKYSCAIDRACDHVLMRLEIKIEPQILRDVMQSYGPGSLFRIKYTKIGKENSQEVMSDPDQFYQGSPTSFMLKEEDHY